MQIKPLSNHFKQPERSSELAGGYDIFMPEAGSYQLSDSINRVPLGFSTAIPEGYVALLLPRSGKGAEFGLALNNTVGVIDADYRGEWQAAVVSRKPISWKRHDKLFQFVIVPCFTPSLEIVEELGETVRGAGGFGSTG